MNKQMKGSLTSEEDYNIYKIIVESVEDNAEELAIKLTPEYGVFEYTIAMSIDATEDELVHVTEMDHYKAYILMPSEAMVFYVTVRPMLFEELSYGANFEYKIAFY